MELLKENAAEELADQVFDEVDEVRSCDYYMFLDRRVGVRRKYEFGSRPQRRFFGVRIYIDQALSRGNWRCHLLYVSA